MAQDIIHGDVLHTGQVQFERPPRVPDGSFGDPQVGANNPIGATKLKHQYAPLLAQAHGSAAADERRVVHVARSAGTVEACRAGPVVAAIGDSTVTVDLRKNGSSILTAVLTIDSGDAAYSKLSASIDEAGYLAGDVFEVIIDATAGTGTLPQGVWAQPVFREGSG